MALNNRPITYLYTESDLIEPVTPNKLLFERNLLYINTEHCNGETDETILTKRYKTTSISLKHFWNRWQQEYMTELREFTKNENRHGISVKAYKNLNGLIGWIGEQVKQINYYVVKTEKCGRWKLLSLKMEILKMSLKSVNDEGTKMVKVAGESTE